MKLILPDTTNVDKTMISDEWNAAVPKVQEVSRTWAEFSSLKNASSGDFDDMDIDKDGQITLEEFCIWGYNSEIKSSSQLGREINLLQ